ncbi:FAD binding domain-containing protein [Boeremia exigua]|uniref:FAD binding domain-containing protein n=1 Tax=Boeremia exigua TaxID=749465 RepID=UPI001E8E6794|nr:FAD binding domain-containing protein [Boeremia exigua]KAH6629142.1 FAD binding domain-containing protein [Boeremia exigua]
MAAVITADTQCEVGAYGGADAPCDIASTDRSHDGTTGSLFAGAMYTPRKLVVILTSFVVILTAVVYHSKPHMFSTILDDDMSTKCAIVVGSGLAGLSAASQLVKRNVPVRVLEQAAKPGGNSIKASSGINGAPTRFQPALEPEDAFYADTVSSAGKRMFSHTTERENLIKTLTEGSAGAVHWLVEEKGVDLSKVARLGGHSYARTHRGPGPPPGFAIISALLKSLKESPLFHLQTSCTVTKVLQERKRVIGVEYIDSNGNYEELHGPVIFASGGFGGDAKGLLAQYRPDLAGFPSTNDPRPGTQPLLAAAGAQLVDMDSVQVHPTGFVDPADPESPLKFLAAELLRGEGGILLLNGARFVNELDTREHVANAITSTPAPSETARQWAVQLVLDEATYSAAKSHVDFYIFKNLMRKTTVADLGADALKTIETYAATVSHATADPFGRTAFGAWALKDPTPESVVYVGQVTPIVHYTMGGVLINAQSEVVTEHGAPIAGLWGAGEITGGIHGGNRLGGSSLLECVVFGRIAGDGDCPPGKESAPAAGEPMETKHIMDDKTTQNTVLTPEQQHQKELDDFDYMPPLVPRPIEPPPIIQEAMDQCKLLLIAEKDTRNTIERLSSELEQAVSVVDTLRTEKSTMTSQHEGALKEQAGLIRSLREMIDSLTEANDELYQVNTTQSAEIVKLRGQITALEASNCRGEHQRHAVTESDLSGLGGQVGPLQIDHLAEQRGENADFGARPNINIPGSQRVHARNELEDIGQPPESSQEGQL